MNKVTLQLSDGRKLVFSGVEAISISEETMLQRPQEDKWFAVNPLKINQNLFKEKRSDSRQEATRELILEAFEEMEKNSKYAKPFKTMMPEKTWEMRTTKELKALAEKLGDCNANWVEQALEWAQRIANGETWEAICNAPDTAKWPRLVVWKGGTARIIGSSCIMQPIPMFASYVRYDAIKENDLLLDAVPLVVLYDYSTSL